MEAEHATDATRASWRQYVREAIKAVKIRDGQNRFREAVLARYQGRCAITGECTAAVLDAAHIVPVSENVSYAGSPVNGICLRADLHRLFDRGLLWFDGDRVIIADEIRGTAYGEYHGVRVQPAPIKSLAAERAQAASSGAG